MNIEDGKYDIVYFVKDTPVNEELRYSLRSVVANFPYNKVVFVGGCPKGLKPDYQIDVEQNEKTKWENTSLLLKTVCKDKNVTSDFILFNDDFFIMSPVRDLPMYYNGTLGRRILDLATRYTSNNYRNRLKACKDMLTVRNYTDSNYAIHVPIPIDKKLMLDCMAEFPQGLMWRSLYGNYVSNQNYHTRQMKDVKIISKTTEPTGNEIFLSTDDKSFSHGKVGEYIKKRFPNPSSYESDS